jgi:RNA polymerase sigma-70 factor, ECF subfamily
MLQALRDRPQETLPLETWDAPTQAANPLDRIMVERAVGVLEPEQRRLIELAFFQGYSHQEVTDLTGVPLGTVKTRIRSALARMREHLERARTGTAGGSAQEGGQAP